MVGIFLALQLNNWNEDRKARVQEKIILAEIHEEFLYNKVEWEINISRYREVVSVLDTLRDLFPLDTGSMNLDASAEMLSDVNFTGDYDESTTTVDKLKNTSFDIISNEELRSLLLQWEVCVEDFTQMEGMMLNFHVEHYSPVMRVKFKLPYHEGFNDSRSDMAFLKSFEFENLIRSKGGSIRNMFRLVETEDDTRNIVKIMDRIIELSKLSE
jgi:hypothetical protein